MKEQCKSCNLKKPGPLFDGKCHQADAKGAREMKKQERVCHDCATPEGAFHLPGCDMEICPFCSGQLLSCDCRYRLLGFDPNKLATSHPKIYQEGLPDELEDAFELLLKIRGRIRYYAWPVLCVYCGKYSRAFFNVPDEEWQKYIPPAQQRKVICRPCYDHIVACQKELGE